MSSSVTLTPGVRSNLLALQQTAELLTRTQDRLSTGKKVNSALDNPINFFTGQSLSTRAGDLNGLLDLIGQATQTLKAADKGINSLTTLVNSAKAIAKQAQQAAAGDATYSTSVTGNVAIAADTTRVTSSDFSTAIGSATASVKSSYVFDAAAVIAAATEGNTLTLSNGTQSITFEYDGAVNDGVAFGNVEITAASTAANIESALNTVFGNPNVSLAGSTITVTGTDYTTNFSAAAGTAGLTTLVTKTDATDGDTLTLTQGATTTTYRYVASGATPAADGTFTSLADIVTAIDALAGTVDASDTGSDTLRIDDASGFTVGGDLGNLLGFNGVGSTTAYDSNYNSTLAGLSGILSITVGSGSAQNIDLSTVNTKAELSTALGNLTGVTATINGGNFINFNWTTSDTLNISGTGTAASGLFAGGDIGDNAAVVSGGGTSTIRAGLQTQYNDLLTQIDQMAADSSYNGINLMNGDDLTVTFNETGTSSLTITGVTYNSTGLGLSSLAGTEFQSNATIDTVIGDLDDALTSLRSQASNFGSKLTTVQTRQDFTKGMINVLQIGADNLVLADTNEESANMLALQTRQQLSTVALSLAAQADQNVLRLF